MRKIKKEEYNIFSASVIDLFASALGVFIIFVMILIPKMNKTSDKTEDNKNSETYKQVETKKESFKFKINQLPTKLKTEKIQSIKFKKNDVAYLHHVNFASNSNVFLPGSKEQLDALAEKLLLNQNLKIEIRGHTNATPGITNTKGEIVRFGKAKNRGWIFNGITNEKKFHYNNFIYTLSKVRADQVCRYLISSGVLKSQLRCVGMSNTHLLYKFPTYEQMAYNRRVEMKVIDIKKTTTN